MKNQSFWNCNASSSNASSARWSSSIWRNSPCGDNFLAPLSVSGNGFAFAALRKELLCIPATCRELRQRREQSSHELSDSPRWCNSCHKDCIQHSRKDEHFSCECLHCVLPRMFLGILSIGMEISSRLEMFFVF